jgi:PAS domain S-box-containing protein
MNSPLKILLVEDNPGDARLIQVMLAEGQTPSHFEVTWVDKLSKALEFVAANHPEAILLDLSLPDSQGLGTVVRIVEKAPDIPIIILTGTDDEVLAVKALQEGAQDYLPKGQLDNNLLARTIRYGMERKLAEQSLRESEEHYRLLFESNPLPLWVYDLETLVFLAVNEAAVNHYGYGRDEFLSMTIEDIRPAEDLPDLRRNLSEIPKLLESSGPWRHTKKDGQLIDVEINSHDILFDGRRARLVLITDITERLRAEIAEYEQRTLAEALRDIAAALNSTLDLDELLGRILDNVGRVVPHELANIVLLESGMTRLVRIQGNDEYGFLRSSNAEKTVHVDEVPYYRRMLETGQAALIADTHQDSSWLQQQGAEWIRSYVGVPIRVRGQNIGFINLDSATPGFFTPVHAERLQAFANQAGSALENAHSLEEIRQRLKELEAINKISTALRVSQTLDEMIPQLLAETIKTFNGVAGSIWFYEPLSDEVRMVHQLGWNDAEFSPVKRGEKIPGHVVASGQAYVSREFKTDPKVPESDRPIFPPGWGGACTPIWAADEIIGVMFVNIALPQEFSEANLDLLTTLAEIAGNAIHRARLHEQTVQRLERIAALHNIDVAISSGFDLQLTLNVLLAQVTAQLNVDAADVLLFDTENNILEFACGSGFRNNPPDHSHIRLGDGLIGQIVFERRTLRISDLTKFDENFEEAEMIQSEGFISYHGVPLVSKGLVSGILEVFHRKPFRPDADWLDFLETLAGQAAIAIDSANLFRNLQRSNLELSRAYDATIEGWSRALDLRDKETEGHTRRVTDVSLRLAQTLGLNTAELVHMRRGGLLHDIGKMGVPDSILLKPDKLTDEEWAIMRLHPVYAYEMLSPIQYLRSALDIPYCHHEKWDGSGYPRRLAGDQIPFTARIFAVVDVWDALRSDRPYRKGWPEEKILDYIREQAGIHFDPAIAREFLKIIGLNGSR